MIARTALAIAFSFAASLSAAEPALLLRDVHLVDGTGAPVRRHASVLASSGVVREIGDALEAPPGARIVEGRGRFLIPGLWDMHVHLSYGDETDLGVLVANGVTAVRDMGGDLERVDAWNARMDKGELVGPRIFRSGPVVDGPKPGVPHRLTVTNAEEGRTAVTRLQELGADFIKIHNAVPRDAFFALAREASKRGLRFAGHVPMTVEPAEAAEAGQHSVEHIATLIEGTYAARFGSETAAVEAMPGWVAEEVPVLAGTFARKGTWFVPTIIAYDLRARRGELADNPDPRLRYASPALRRYWDATFPLTERDRDPKGVARRKAFVELGKEMTRRMHEAGVGIAVGTDVAGRDVLPGFAVHDEIRILAESGLGPMAALQAATANPARLLHVAGTHGTVAPGKVADLVLLDGDPLADIRNTGRISAVVLRGRLLERADLDRLLEQAGGSGSRALAIAREVERIAASRTLWPGFDPMAVPLAVYDGERTYLFRHPAPPEGFAPVAGAQPAAWAMAGRHPAVVANTSVEIGGTATATLAIESIPGDPVELASVALHEAFHVFQRQRHPDWQGNEGDLLIYPVDDARLLTLRRLESEALRRALAQPETRLAACWARQALAFRSERFAGMDPAFAAYERGTEINEGLAAHVQRLAAGRTTVDIPEGEFPATRVRLRAYTAGEALALLLDRFRPGWPEALEADDKQRLDGLLGAVLRAGSAEGAGEGGCALTAAERAAVERTAAGDVAKVRADRAGRRKAFDARPGWRVIVESAQGRPLWPQGFDPLNVETVEGGLLHTRFLRLGNDSGKLQAIDEPGADLEVFSEAAGEHPLFQGVRRVTIAGLAKPEIETGGGAVELRSPGFTARFENARVEVLETGVVVRLP